MSRNRNNNKKKDITLMTVIAGESTGKAQDLLAKYGIPKASSYSDLENKLNQLYINTNDKVQLEKELAEIHPHRKWMIKTLSLISENDIKKEPTEEKSKMPDVFSFFDSHTNQCNCPHCKNIRFSNAEGITDKKETKADWMQFIGPLAMVTVLAVTLIVVVKSTSKM